MHLSSICRWEGSLMSVISVMYLSRLFLISHFVARILFLVVKIFTIKIFTTRNKILTAKWLAKNNLDKYISDITDIKEPAFLHIDDRCICFDGNFNNTINQIQNFKPWYK